MSEAGTNGGEDKKKVKKTIMFFSFCVCFVLFYFRDTNFPTEGYAGSCKRVMYLQFNF